MIPARRLALLAALCPVVLLLFALPAQALVSTGDGGWVWQNPLPVGAHLQGVAFADTQLGWAVGAGGVIMHSADGGTTWQAQKSGTTKDLEAVTCASASVAWAVGMSGTLVHTTDGGVHWAVQGAGTGSHLYAVDCADASHAWAVGWGGVITHTTDGVAWTTQTSPTANNLRGVASADATHAWAVGGDAIVHTTNGGTSWKTQTAPASSSLEAVACFDANHAWAVGDGGAIARTTNGGTTWTAGTSNAPSSNLLGVAAGSASRVWAAGTSGAVVSSTNGGATWQKATSGTTEYLTAVACSGATHAWVVGRAGTVIRTIDGSTWTGATSGLTNDFNGVAQFSAGAPLAVGYDANAYEGVIAAWNPIQQQWVSQTPNTTYSLIGLATSGTFDACAVGAHGTILTTSDGGTTWTSRSAGTLANLYAVAYGTTRDIAVGQSGQTCLSYDGTTWYPEGSYPNTSDLYGVTTYTISGGEYIVAVGAGGAIMRSTDAGFSWASATSTPVYHDLYGVTNVSDGSTVTLWAVGAYGTILTSTDGLNWTAETSHTAEGLMDVNVQGSKLIAAGDGGTIDYSPDGGATWTVESSGTTGTLNGALVGPLDSAWAVGNAGTILYTATDGVAPAPDTAPPVTNAVGVPTDWRKAPLTVSLQASDADTGVACTWWELDQTPSGLPASAWTAGLEPVVRTDGQHTLYFYSVDNAGNPETPGSVTVYVDAKKPVPKAPRAASVKHGKVATLKYSVSDARPGSATAAVTVTIKNAKGKVVKKLPAIAAVPVNTAETLKFTCKLSKGSYKFSVSAKDSAGNVCAKAASNKLKVT